MLLLSIAACNFGFAIGLSCPSQSDQEGETRPSRSTLEIALEHVAGSATVKPSDSVFPGASSQIRLGYPDCDYDRRCYCQHSFSYRIQAVDDGRSPILQKKSEELSQKPMFGCYITGTDLRGKKQHRCRFVRRVTLDRNDAALQGITLPKDIGASVSAWVESAVRVDQVGLPIEETAPVAMALLIEGGDHTYEVIEDFMPNRTDCDIEVSFAGKVFDFSSCKRDVACINKVVGAVHSSVRAELAKDPLNAAEVRDQPIPPGEIWMRHDFKSSKVLGAPYFELTTYVLKFWFAGLDRGPSSTEPNVYMHSLYMNVAQSITRAVGVNGRYEEPTKEQLAAYRSAMNQAVSHALTNACYDIGGQFKESICHY
jgi:hypothetical protein